MHRSLNDEQWRTACELLSWMVCAKRSLRWHEIQAVRSINTSDQTFDFMNQRLRDDIQFFCGCLIQVLRGDRVELVHTTAKMYHHSQRLYRFQANRGRYIPRTKHMRLSSIECNLAALCLHYLTFECFNDDVAPERLRDYAMYGYLSLQDYAVAKWSDHVHAIVKMPRDSFFEDHESAKALKTIEQALEDFSIRYENEIYHQQLTEEAKVDCKAHEGRDFYWNLVHIWGHVRRQQDKGVVARNDISLDALGKVVKRNRELIENLSSKDFEHLTTFYGNKFKCPKLTCFYFHEGFENAKRREKHVNKHDRPFICDILGCSIAEFGFSSNAELDKHKRFFHTELTDQALTFKAAKEPVTSAKWQCNLCGKRFTRKFSHNNHVNSHNGDRPYACSECGKAFTRANDCRRHEKIHNKGYHIGQSSNRNRH